MEGELAALTARVAAAKEAKEACTSALAALRDQRAALEAQLAELRTAQTEVEAEVGMRKTEWRVYADMLRMRNNMVRTALPPDTPCRLRTRARRWRGCRLRPLPCGQEAREGAWLQHCRPSCPALPVSTAPCTALSCVQGPNLLLRCVRAPPYRLALL